MDEELFLKELRSRTTTLVWVLFILDLTIVFSAPAATKPIWSRAVMLALEFSMATVFALRKDWIRAGLFGAFTINSFYNLSS